MLNLLFQPDYDDIEDDYGRAMKHPIMEEKRSKHDDKKKYGELHQCVCHRILFINTQSIFNF